MRGRVSMLFLVINHGFQFLGRYAEKGGYLVRRRLEIPYMRNGNGQFDVSHPFPADFLFSHFHAATVADDTAVSDSLVFSAVAFVVFGRTENLLTEKTVSLRLVSPVVDCLRLQDFS